MYKHECVNCFVKHKYICIWNINFFSRFLGNKEVLYCPEYMKITKLNSKRLIKK